MFLTVKNIVTRSFEIEKCLGNLLLIKVDIFLTLDTSMPSISSFVFAMFNNCKIKIHVSIPSKLSRIYTKIDSARRKRA